MFELRRLHLLHQLSLRGTISEVARELGYSPSSVSQQLALLEREAGVPLLEPAGRRVKLTHQGRILAVHAARMLQYDETVRQEISASRRMATRVRVAVMPTVAQALAPRVITRLRDTCPSLRLEVVEMAPEEALFELSARTFDLVVAEQYPGRVRELNAAIDKHVLGDDPVRIVLPRGDQARELSDLRSRPWILEPQGAAVRDWAVQQCRAAGFEPDVQFEATDLTSHVRMVASGNAVAILPDLIWTGDRDRVTLLDLPGAPHREIFAASRAASRGDRAVDEVRSALREALASHALA